MTAPDPTRAEQWRAVAEQALTAYEACSAPASFQAFTWSQALIATATLYGWDDPRVQLLIDAIMGVRNPDGGWGLNATRDQYGDGSVNPANTSYTVTMAGHVGPAFLSAFQAGKLKTTVADNDLEPLKRITQLLMGTARSTTSAGVGVSYSRSANDTGKPLIHNVSAGVGAYLTTAAAAGFGQSGLQSLVVDITRREVAAYSRAWYGWAYQDGQTSVQDPDHGAYSAASMYGLCYPVGREAVYINLVTAAVNDDGRRGHMALVSLPGGPTRPGSMAIDGSTSTLWASMGDQWIPDSVAYVTSAAGDAMRLAQAAALCAANAIATQEV